LTEAERGTLISLDVFNDTGWPHAMHLHGHHFWVLSPDGAPLHAGKRDTHLMQPGERASLVFVADNPGLWLFHCHMMEHHAAGMAAVVAVL
jgi:FtsP/CotA-like multicopper oxidase with cupredoxin domain